MNNRRTCLAAAFLALPVTTLLSHDLSGLGYDRSIAPPDVVVPGWFVAKDGTAPSGAAAHQEDPAPTQAPDLARVFNVFSPRVRAHADSQYLYVESSGLPEHNLMVGITNWQQQVPIPQDYTGKNAWRIPLTPVPSASPLSIKGRFLRGAIALAANGVPIFNPQNNRGEVSAEIGELDQWGGHCGRADDYHYHAAPLHLQEKVGKGMPIAVALDGYPIYALTEPDGSTPTDLDSFHGHRTPELGYHYHASTTYPYVNGGFHGEVTEAGGQVDPQPAARPARPATGPLHGAAITGFERTGPDSFELTYTLGSDTRHISYSASSNGAVTFDFQNGSPGSTKETYMRHDLGGGGQNGPNRPPGQGDRYPGAKAPPGTNRNQAPRPPDPAPQPVPTQSGPLILRSPVVANGGDLPVEYTGDGNGISPPLSWSGAPEGTKAYALIMHHLAPDGMTKWYWTLYNIPPETRELSKNAKGIGSEGNNSINRSVGYAPPHSKGPGPKTYILTLYALSEPLRIERPASEINREVLLEAMKGKVLSSSELRVVATRISAESSGRGSGERIPKPRGEAQPPTEGQEPRNQPPA